MVVKYSADINVKSDSQNNGQMNSIRVINASCLTKGHTSSRLTFISSPLVRGIFTSVSDIPFLFSFFCFFFIEKSQLKQ